MHTQQKFLMRSAMDASRLNNQTLKINAWRGMPKKQDKKMQDHGCYACHVVYATEYWIFTHIMITEISY